MYWNLWWINFACSAPWCRIYSEWRTGDSRLRGEQIEVSHRRRTQQGCRCRIRGGNCSRRIFLKPCRRGKDSTRSHSNLRWISVTEECFSNVNPKSTNVTKFWVWFLQVLTSSKQSKRPLFQCFQRLCCHWMLERWTCLHTQRKKAPVQV